jgi:aspartyl-tRNA(Asn)/glutamyl-tRNA(Gln) amidotransferase subunit A
VPKITPHRMTIARAARELADGVINSAQLVEACLACVSERDGQIAAMTQTYSETAMQEARASDNRRANGESRGVLDGIPYTLKDIFATKGRETTAASALLKGWVPPYSATVVQRLEAAGAILLGKVNTDEFTMGGSTETSVYGVTRNPYDVSRVAGGSSGGSAAAVAAGFGLFSIGTDTGGSIRQPAHFCGVTGLKPTYGRISRFGQLPMASSFDQAGPLTKSAEDAGLVLAVLAGQDDHDASSSSQPVDDYQRAMKPISQLRVGIAEQFFGAGLDVQVEQVVRRAIAEFEAWGAQIVPVSLPSLAQCIDIYYILVPAEISSNMARYDGVHFGKRQPAKNLKEVYTATREKFGDEVKRRIILGTHVLSSGYYDAYYGTAQAARTVVRQEFDQVFNQVDVLLAPVTPNTAFGIGEKINDMLAMYLEDVLTVPANVAGLPAMSMPAGAVHGLPVGLQMIAAPFQESTLLAAARYYQEHSTVNHCTPYE